MAQVVLGYLLMLGVMTYSIYIFISITFGLTIGQYIFAWRLGRVDQSQYVNMAETNTVNDPCC